MLYVVKQLLLMVYKAIKYILRLYFPLFFNKIHVEGLHKVPNNKPVLFAVNHQNTMIDATLVAYKLKKNTFFLVRSDVFTGPIINWILKILHLIPISRGKDRINDMAGFNKKTFSSCIDHLNQKKMILIFPEGQSSAKYQLSKFKKGVARLALQAEAENEFKLDLHLIPVTINYENHFQGNSNVWIKYCDPIVLKNQKNNYKKNNARTINVVLRRIEESIRHNMVHFDDHESSKPFFEMVLEQSIDSTSSLLALHKGPSSIDANPRKHQHSKLYNLVSIISKLSFSPAIIATLTLERIVKDIDFKLSVISFSLLMFSAIQIVLIAIFTTVLYGWPPGALALTISTVLFVALIKTYFTKN